MQRSIRLAASAFCAVLFSTTCLVAQGDRGFITGVVRDSSGAIVPGAVVRASNVDTNVPMTAVSNDQGVYTLSLLLAGRYSIRVDKEGFKTTEEQSVVVRVNDRLNLDFILQVGQMADVITVAGNVSLLDTASSSIGTVIDNRRIQDLPLLHGNPFMLQFLTPGITFSGNVAFTRPFDSAAGESSVNGSKTRSVEFQLDGTADTWGRSPAYTPSVEFIQEYRVQTASYDASEGHTSGATVNVSLKSGTNQWHGSAYDYLQNRVLNANLFFNNKAGQPRPAYSFNRWGATAGGPIRKDRTFFFMGYEGIRHKLPDPRVLTVPNDAQRKGDFSSLLALGSQYQIYDPATTRSEGNGRFSRAPFPGNIIPSSRFNSVGKAILDAYPDPNQPGSADGAANFQWGEGVEPDRYWTTTTRIDHNLSERRRLFGRLVLSKRQDGPYREYFPGASGNNLFYRNRGANIDYIDTLNPQTVLNLRYGYTRFTAIHNLSTSGFDIASLGFPQSLKDAIDPRALVFPTISIAGYQGLNTETEDGKFADIHSFLATVSQTRGKHILRFGGDFRMYLDNEYNFGAGSGTYSFNTGYTNGPFDNSPSSPLGQGVAGVLLGIPDTGRIDRNDSFAARTPYFGLFLQDDWKVTSRLTLNIGLRYEYEGAITERYDRSVRGFAYSAASPIEIAARENYALQPIPQISPEDFQVKGGLMFANTPGASRGLWYAPATNLMPRVGFAFSFNPRTVIRGGYGLFFDQIGITTNLPIQTGFSQETAFVPTIDNGLSFRATLSNPFPDGLLAAAGNRNGLSTFLGRSISFYPASPRTPYNQRWSFGLQRELMGRIGLDVTYVGNRGTAIQTSRQLDGIPNQYLSKLRVRDQATIDLLSKAVPNPFYPLLPGTGLSGTTVALSQLLRPYPQYTGVTALTNDGYSWYHGLQTRVERRFSGGYTLMGAWTWSKNMEAVSFLNPMDTRPERVISANDRTHRIVINGVWELPFGPGRRYLSQAPGLIGKLLEGWQLDGILQHQTGDPLGLGDFLYSGNPEDIVLPAGQRRPEKWFNAANFERNSRNQLASNVRYQSSLFSGLRADGLDYLDLSAIKKTKLTEGISLDFRSEFVNALNHTVFEKPDTNPTSSTFGVVTAAKALPRTIQFGLILRF